MVGDAQASNSAIMLINQRYKASLPIKNLPWVPVKKVKSDIIMKNRGNQVWKFHIHIPVRVKSSLQNFLCKRHS